MKKFIVRVTPPPTPSILLEVEAVDQRDAWHRTRLFFDKEADDKDIGTIEVFDPDTLVKVHLDKQ